MATTTVDSFGAFAFDFRNTGEDESVLVNIGVNLTGTLRITSSEVDGDQLAIQFVLPTGWMLNPTGSAPIGTETPPAQVFNYLLSNDSGASIATVQVIANVVTTVPCFTRGTRILCADGKDRAIENLGVNDLVMTADRGLQPIRWIGRRKLGEGALTMFPKLRPVRIRKNALGPNVPNRTLRVSRQHRMLLTHPAVKHLTGEDSVLVPAAKLTGLPGVGICKSRTEVEYLHLLFDRHEIIFANGAPSESLHTGPEALKALGPEAVDEIHTLFPELADETPRAGARRFVDHGDAKCLVAAL